jgi:hypothetical protein
MTTIEKQIHFRRGRKSEKNVEAGPKPSPPKRVPRIARLMALAIHFDELIRSGRVRNYTELAELGHVSKTRITHIMNLTLLPARMQEKLLFAEEEVLLRDLQEMAREVRW